MESMKKQTICWTNQNAIEPGHEVGGRKQNATLETANMRLKTKRSAVGVHKTENKTKWWKMDVA